MILQINSQPSLAVNIPIMITPNLRHNPSLLIDVKDFVKRGLKQSRGFGASLWACLGYPDQGC